MKTEPNYAYAAVFTKENDNGYSVHFPQIDGCYTQGNTFEEAYQMAIDALSLHLAGMLQDGEPLPEPHFAASDQGIVVLISANPSFKHTEE